MLQYDEEKLNPGELETAQKKAGQIEGLIRDCHERQGFAPDGGGHCEPVFIPLSEHVTGKFFADFWYLYDLMDYEPYLKLKEKIIYTLRYDEDWLVPGELEYAESKAAEIASRVKKYNDGFKGEGYGVRYAGVAIPITEHIKVKFTVKLSGIMFDPPDCELHNFMLLDWFEDEIGTIEPPKIFELPEDDIRCSLPEWDESMLPKDALKDIKELHSARYGALELIEHEGGDYGSYTKKYFEKKKIDMGENEFYKIKKSLARKLKTPGCTEAFTREEEMLGNYFAYRNLPKTKYSWVRNEMWCFPVKMNDADIVSAIREAYQNASVKSRRIIPDEWDNVNLASLPSGNFPVKSYERLYQAKAGDMVIRFLFDFKNMKIKMAYPVPKKKGNVEDLYKKYDYYDESCKCFFTRW